MSVMCTGPCLAPWHWNFSFPTDLDCHLKIISFWKQSWLCTHTAPFVHRPVHARGSVRAHKEQSECMLRKKSRFFLFNRQSLFWERIDEISWKSWIPMSRGCVTAQARKGRCACMHPRGLNGWEGVPTTPKSFGVMIFSYASSSTPHPRQWASNS